MCVCVFENVVCSHSTQVSISLSLYRINEKTLCQSNFTFRFKKISYIFVYLLVSKQTMIMLLKQSFKASPYMESAPFSVSLSNMEKNFTKDLMQINF